MEVLRNHPAILDDPEPQVLVEQLASSTINLAIYAWVDANQHSWVKVKSSVMRLVLKAFEQAGFSMPDDQREIVFPAGVPVQMLEHQQENNPSESVDRAQKSSSDEDVSNTAEGDFRSEAGELQEQAEKSRDPDSGEANLLSDSTQP